VRFIPRWDDNEHRLNRFAHGLPAVNFCRGRDALLPDTSRFESTLPSPRTTI
jgi:hypothetical protein